MKTVFSNCHSSAFKSQITIIKITIIKIKLLVLKIDLKMAVCGLRFFRFFILSPPPFCLCVCVYPQRPEDSVQSGVTGICEPLAVGTDNQTGVFWESSICSGLLTPLSSSFNFMF